MTSKRRRRRRRGKARGFSWSEAFAPRSNLPAADSVPVLTRGSIGRRAIAIGDMPEDHLRLIETAVANLDRHN
jgi:hypothetical protein